MRRAIEERSESETEANRVTQSLAAMAFALLLVVVGLFLVQHWPARRSSRTACCPAA